MEKNGNPSGKEYANLIVHMSVVKDGVTFEKKVKYMFEDKEGNTSKPEYISFGRLFNNRPLDSFHKYGFTKDEVNDITRDMKYFLTVTTCQTEKALFNEVHRWITEYAEDKKYMEDRDTCKIPVKELRKWFSDEAEMGWKYLEFLRTLRERGKLKSNKGRLDYRNKADGKRYYRFDAWKERTPMAGCLSFPVPPADHEQELGGVA